MSTETDIDLESLLQEDDLHCESPHRFVKECTVEVFYVVTDCTGSYKTCRNVVEHPEQGTLVRKDNPRQLCAGCGRLAKDCWKVRPI